MKQLLLILSLALASCSVMDTSFYDDNESLLAVDVRVAVDKLNCESEASIAYLKGTIDRIYFYSESKGSKDIYSLLGKMKETTNGMEYSQSICNLKKKLLIKQSADIANAIMRRF